MRGVRRLRAAIAFSAAGSIFTFNGVDAMQKIDGVNVATYTGGTIGKYGAVYDNRLWCVDEQYSDILNFSTQSPDATKPMDFTANGTTSNPGTIIFEPYTSLKSEFEGVKFATEMPS